MEYIEFLENHTKEVITSEACKRLAFELLLEDKPDKPFSIVDYYNVLADEVKKGVRCPQCSSIPMRRNHSRWQCGTCGKASRDAHLETLQEFRLLFGPEITSRVTSDFMQHDCIYFAIRVLNNNADMRNAKSRYRLFQINDERHLLIDFIREELKK